tara:strand:- start:253 stop:777 length:525 start_codon:yes stop_codon:yes gene_type:complete
MFDMNKNKIYWILGLSASGKTTLSKILVKELKKQERKVILLDGDNLRRIFDDENLEKSYTREARLNLSFKYAKLVRELSLQGFDVVIATISMFKEIYSWNRKNLNRYVEIYLDVPMEVILSRDPKNLYKKFKMKEIKNVVGLDIIPDIPKDPTILIKYDKDRKLETFLHDIINS